MPIALSADRAVPTMIIHEFVDSTSYLLHVLVTRVPSCCRIPIHFAKASSIAPAKCAQLFLWGPAPLQKGTCMTAYEQSDENDI